MKRQAIIIKGGDTFETYEEYLKFIQNFKIDFERLKSGQEDWKPWLRGQLGGMYDVIIPEMPCRWNAKYDEWKMWFDKFVPFLEDDVVLIGHSLGGSFLAKYLSENKLPKRVDAVMLVAAVYDLDTDGYPLQSFTLPQKIDLQSEKVFLYHSKDDPWVPFEAVEKFKAAIPHAVVRTFADRQHMTMDEFPELLEDIRTL